MPSTTGPSPVVAAARDHTCVRAWATAGHEPTTVAGSSWKKVRYSVESEHTSPNRAGCARNFSI